MNFHWPQNFVVAVDGVANSVDLHRLPNNGATDGPNDRRVTSQPGRRLGDRDPPKSGPAAAGRPNSRLVLFPVNTENCTW